MTIARIAAAGVLLHLCGVAGAAAQEATAARISAETVVSSSMFSGNDRPGAMFDATARIEVGGGASVVIRPWAWRRPDATWTAQFYQLQLRYQARTRLPVRIDAGIITSPLGLNTLQARADLNPTIAPVFYYVVPLPRFDTTFDGLNAMSAGYPLGAIATVSGAPTRRLPAPARPANRDRRRPWLRRSSAAASRPWQASVSERDSRMARIGKRPGACRVRPRLSSMWKRNTRSTRRG
jgi:hypothetical protein